jgi:F420-non-reducing hydrogenase iron-sulfur subunit
MHFEPKIICFLCKWCAYAGADLAGTSRLKYEPNGIIIKVTCSGRVDAQHVLTAFKSGADGVLIGCCHTGSCHYKDGNQKAARKVLLLKRVLKSLGIQEERLRIEQISASESKKFIEVMNDFINKIRSIGPLEV